MIPPYHPSATAGGNVGWSVARPAKGAAMKTIAARFDDDVSTPWLLWPSWNRRRSSTKSGQPSKITLRARWVTANWLAGPRRLSPRSIERPPPRRRPSPISWESAKVPAPKPKSTSRRGQAVRTRGPAGRAPADWLSYRPWPGEGGAGGPGRACHGGGRAIGLPSPTPTFWRGNAKNRPENGREFGRNPRRGTGPHTR